MVVRGTRAMHGRARGLVAMAVCRARALMPHRPPRPPTRSNAGGAPGLRAASGSGMGGFSDEDGGGGEELPLANGGEGELMVMGRSLSRAQLTSMDGTGGGGGGRGAAAGGEGAGGPPQPGQQGDAGKHGLDIPLDIT